MDKATECDSGNERWKWSEWKIWIPAAKSRRLATWIPAVAADRSHQRNRFIMSALTFIFFNSFKFYGKISSQKNFLNMLNHLNIISSNIN